MSMDIRQTYGRHMADIYQSYGRHTPPCFRDVVFLSVVQDVAEGGEKKLGFCLVSCEQIRNIAVAKKVRLKGKRLAFLSDCDKVNTSKAS